MLPAVVNVVSDTAEGQGEGTGFVVRSDGIIVSNYHVVENASKITVLTSDRDPTEYDARVIGGDVEADLAILDIDATDLPTVELGELGRPTARASASWRSGTPWASTAAPR